MPYGTKSMPSGKKSPKEAYAEKMAMNAAKKATMAKMKKGKKKK